MGLHYILVVETITIFFRILSIFVNSKKKEEGREIHSDV